MEPCAQRVVHFNHWNQKEPSRSAGTSLLSLPWTLGSTRIRCGSPMDRIGWCERRHPPQPANREPDSSRAGQWYNGQGYVGVSSPTYGTLTVLRQNALTRDAAYDYDPLGGSYAFSPIGTGITCGGGNTENCRHSTSLKYRLDLDHLRVAALWQFGGYAQNNASNGAYQFQVGADIPTSGRGVLSFDAIYSYVRDSVSLSLGPGTTDANGVPIPPFLPQVLTATISDNAAVMLLAKYTTGPLKLYAGYEQIRYMAPSDPQTAFTDIAGDFLCQGCEAFNNTTISNTAFGVNGLGNKTFQVMWTGVKYAVTDELDVIAAYYHYIQHSFYRHRHRGARPLLRRRARAMRRDVRRDLRRCRLAVCTEVGCLCRDHVHASEWRIGQRLSPAQQHRSHGRVALPLLRLGYDRSVGCPSTAPSRVLPRTASRAGPWYGERLIPEETEIRARTGFRDFQSAWIGHAGTCVARIVFEPQRRIERNRSLHRSLHQRTFVLPLAIVVFL